ncbi:mechanosensitive ion channel family protein [Baaleninema sp.]|uniref:mechanosensitive ion channel family protein n=1 Tax=Baaleninema sp. TaxID=3101197 RepID=UPI003CFFD77F
MTGLSSPLFWLAQSNGNAANDAAEIFKEITALKLVQAIAIVAIAYFSTVAIDKFVRWLAEKVPLRFRLAIAQSLPFWQAFVLGLAIVVLLGLFLDFSANNLIAITGTVAVALGFAFKDYASSVIAGIIALFESPYQVGDRVTIGNQYGEIINYGLRGIRIRTPNDDIVSIPHNKIWTDAIVNANKGNVEAQTVVDFYFAHDIEIDRVRKILERTAQTSKYTQIDFPILVIIEESPWGTHFKLKCYPIDARDEFLYKTDLIRRAKAALSEMGISYPTLSFREEETFW